MDDGHIGTDPYDSQQFRKAATEAASAVLDDFEDVKAGDLSLFEFMLRLQSWFSFLRTWAADLLHGVVRKIFPKNAYCGGNLTQ